MKISVVVPVYGCKEALPELYKRLTVTLSNMTEEYEIILVNDACPQGSWQVIENMCRLDTHVIGLEMARNFGQIKAITAGLDYSSGDWVVVMDCDLQDQPEEIINLYNKAQEGYDVVFARRKVRNDSWMKIQISKLFYSIYSFATGQPYDPALCNFSISKRNVVDAYCSMRELHRAFVMYIQWLGFRETSIDVNHHERFAGKSGYNFKKRINMAIEILTSQSDKLLQLTVKMGLLISLIAAVSIVVIIARYFVMHIQPGWSSIIASIFLMGGITIACIGIVGIYIGNIFMEVKHRPLYVIRQALNVKKDVENEKTGNYRSIVSSESLNS